MTVLPATGLAVTPDVLWDPYRSGSTLRTSSISPPPGVDGSTALPTTLVALSMTDTFVGATTAVYRPFASERPMVMGPMPDSGKNSSMTFGTGSPSSVTTPVRVVAAGPQRSAGLVSEERVGPIAGAVVGRNRGEHACRMQRRALGLVVVRVQVELAGEIQLLEKRPQRHDERPRMGGWGGRSGIVLWIVDPLGVIRKVLGGIMHPVHRQPPLLHVVLALAQPRAFAGSLHRRQEQPDERADDGDDDQQFDQRENLPPRGKGCFPSGLHFSSDVRAKSATVVFPSTGVTFSSVFFRSL